MKKILKTMFALALVIMPFLTVNSVNAESGTNSNDGTIIIENALAGKTYSVYELFELESYDTDKGAYIYTVKEEWLEFAETATTYITLTQRTDIIDGETKYVVSWVEGADAAAFAKLALTYAEANATKVAATKESQTPATDGEISFTNLNLGYYLVDSSLGALCGLDTTVKIATINDKNTPTTIDKTVKEDSGNYEYGDENSAQIGDTVSYKTTITVGAGAHKYVLTDTMSNGLTFSGTVTVKAGDTTATEGTDYELKNVTDNGFVIEFKDSYITSLTAGTEIVIEYTAVINNEAVIEGDGNTNNVTLEYGDGNEVEDQTTTYVYLFDIVKTDTESKLLDGAKFKLYTSQTGGTVIKFVYDETTKTYRVATSADTETTEIIIVTNGLVTISGLDLDTYYVEETEAPEGYNKLTSRVEFTVTEDGARKATIDNDVYQSGGIKIVNKNGTLLPSTGGVGTFLFVTIGTILVLGFGVLLVTKLRMSKLVA